MNAFENIQPTDIAVVGMACRFPDAPNPAAFWTNISRGFESVRFFSDEDLLQAGVDHSKLSDPNFIRAGVVLDGFDQFDAGFFGLSAREAAIMDPQHRVFLECVWEAIEDCGHTPDSFPGRVGVFAGCGMNAYLMFNLLTNKPLMDSTGMFLVRHTGNDKDFLSTRASYQFNLRGPSINIQTACSTSLVAIHMAAQSLLSGECDMALAGGVTIEVPHRHGYLYLEGEILSKDGHCRPFDADSSGTIFGSGCGIVALRRLSDAIESGDTIHAILKGSAVNNDGSSKVGYLAPSVDGQSKAISEALAIANVEASSISYVETHGTGTAVGDPIEITALTQAFRQTSSASQFCAIGSVKSNIGHLDTAAGVASFVKTVQALRHRQIPPSLHFRKANPLIDFASTPFFVNSELREWANSNGPRRASINSLGVGGTNAHVVLEEAPRLAPSPTAHPLQVITISARSAAALDEASRRFAEALDTLPEARFPDAAFTSQSGRKRFRHRRSLAARSAAEAASILRAGDPKRLVTTASDAAGLRPVFMFPGGGAQYPNMGRQLFAELPTYRRHVEECLALLPPPLRTSLQEAMYPEPDRLEQAAASLARPLLSILSIFICEYALVQQLLAWGVVPSASTGHSLGEYTSACLSGVISLQDTLSLVIARGEIFERMPAGAMLSVSLPEQKLRESLGQDLSIAAINGTASCVVSGQTAAIEKLEQSLQAREIECARLHISVAAHSPMLDPFLDEFAALCARIPLSEPRIPYISNLTGDWVKPSDLTPDYWVRHLRGTVRFSSGLSVLFQNSNLLLVEVGPGTSLSNLARQHQERTPAHFAFASMRHPKEEVSDVSALYAALGRIWTCGGEIDWDRFWAGEPRARIPLPTYPFERKRHWIEPGRVAQLGAGEPLPELSSPRPDNAITKQPNMDSWFWKPVWEPQPLDAGQSPAKGHWLVFCDEAGVGAALAKQLNRSGHVVSTVSIGAHFSAADESQYVLSPHDASHWGALIASLIDADRVPKQIVYCWGAGEASRLPLPDRIEDEIDRCLWAPVALLQALVSEDLADGLDLTFITRGAKSTAAGEPVQRPELSMLAGPVKVIPNEFPSIATRWIDLEAGAPSADTARIADLLLREILTSGETGRSVAYRGDSRWVERWVPAPPPAASPVPAFRDGAAYIITGGLGGMALTFARHLSGHHKARVALIHRTMLPPREEWSECLSRQPEANHSRIIRELLEIEALGGEIHTCQCDVSQPDSLLPALRALGERLGPIHGILHTAGVLQDGSLLEKTRQGMTGVLSPKVFGALALHQALPECNPEFLILFSSTSALLGLAGQVDYVAANAFLDAYALSPSAGKTRVISVNWGVWNSVGMAAKSAALSNATLPLMPPFPLSPQQSWLLSEHRVRQGAYVLPGTAYIDLALRAARSIRPEGPIELHNLNFLSPMTFDQPADLRHLSVESVAAHDHVSILISSTHSGSPAATLHAQVDCLEPRSSEPERLDLDAVRTRCSSRLIDVGAGERWTSQTDFLDFGPRWHNIRRLWLGERELLGELTLHSGFSADLASHPAHPALLDMATSAGIALTSDALNCSELYVPLAYRRILAYAPLPEKIYAHVHLRRFEQGDHGVAVFDITITDPEGRALLQIDDFTMRRISPALLSSSAHSAQASALESRPASAEATRLRDWVAAGIAPQEGVAILTRILADPSARHLAASSIDLQRLLRIAGPRSRQTKPGAPPQPAGSGCKVEASLQRFWGELLGVDSPGLDEDFFELGGHSLLAVRLFVKIRKAYNLDLGLTTLFEARTIRQLAAIIRKGVGEEHGEVKKFSCLVPLRKTGSKPPLFCVHGVGGNVLGYNGLSRLLPEDQPFYAIQSRGLSREAPPSTDMREIAAGYVREILEVQPEGPYYITGYSFGGVAAYEAALQLQAMGHRVAFLGLFDTDRPNAPMSLSLRLRLNLQHIARLSGEERRKYLLRKWDNIAGRFRTSEERLPATAPPAEPQSSQFQDVRKANFAAYYAYHAPEFHGDVVLFRAAEFGESGFRRPGLGWSDVVRGAIEEVWLPGNHMTILYEPCVSVLAERLSESLMRVYRREGGEAGSALGGGPEPAAGGQTEAMQSRASV